MSIRRDAIWTALDIFLSAGLAFAFRLVIARVLAPHDFGVAAIALSVIAVLQVASDFGLTATLIQKDEARVTPKLVNTTFTASLIISVCMAAVTAFVVAPLAARFYNEPALAPLLMVLAVNLLPSAFTTVSSAMLFRARRFRAVAINKIVCAVTAVLAALVVLLIHPGPWVVVCQAVVSALIVAVGLTMTAGWSFRLALERAHLKEIFGFSSFVLANDLIIALSANSGVFIVGRLIGAGDAGLYSLAVYVTDTIRQALTSITNRVTFVHYSINKYDLSYLRQALISALVWNCRIIFPVMTALICFGPQLAVHFIGPEWSEMGAVMQWLALSAMVLAAGGNTSTLYKALGRPGVDLALLAGSIFALLIPGMILGATMGGLVGVAIATAVTRLINNVVRQVLLDRLIGNVWGAAIKAVARLLLMQIPIVAVWFVGRMIFPRATWVETFIMSLVAAMIYFVLEFPVAFPGQFKKAKFFLRKICTL
ncbi:oligosaccharide flippase family protein [Brevundimonas sp. SL130]|nr:oligosaccharide flippase family protein [Brevundimonas sp. SL130]